MEVALPVWKLLYLSGSYPASLEVTLPVWKLPCQSGSYPASLEVALQHNSGLSVRELLLRVKYLQSIVMCLMLSLEHGDLLKVVSKVSRA